jgi:hypothetical protein
MRALREVLLLRLVAGEAEVGFALDSGSAARRRRRVNRVAVGARESVLVMVAPHPVSRPRAVSVAALAELVHALRGGLRGIDDVGGESPLFRVLGRGAVAVDATVSRLLAELERPSVPGGPERARNLLVTVGALVVPACRQTE